jgi:hypothetical protein
MSITNTTTTTSFIRFIASQILNGDESMKVDTLDLIADSEHEKIVQMVNDYLFVAAETGELPVEKDPIVCPSIPTVAWIDQTRNSKSVSPLNAYLIFTMAWMATYKDRVPKGVWVCLNQKPWSDLSEEYNTFLKQKLVTPPIHSYQEAIQV